MFSRIWQQLSAASPVAKVTATLWLCLLVLLELLGRETKSDWFDLASFVALIIAFILTIRVHRRQPLAIVTWLVLKIDRGLKQFRKSLMNFGVDFRPPAHHRLYGLPRLWGAIAIATFPLTLLAIVTTFYPAAFLRELAAGNFYLPWLGLWSLIVITGISAMLIHGVFFYLGLHDMLMEHAGKLLNNPRQADAEDDQIRRRIHQLSCLALAFVFVAALLLPCRWGVNLILGMYGLILLSILCCGQGLLFTCRQAPGTRLMHIDGRWLMTIQWSFPISLAVPALIFAGTLPNATAHQLPALHLLQGLITWIACLGSLMITVINLRYLLLATVFHPARIPHELSVKPVATVHWKRYARSTAQLFSATLGRIQKLVIPQRVHTASATRPTDSAGSTEVNSSLAPTASLWHDSETFLRVRRFEIAARRELLRGLEKLMKPLSRQTESPPTGILVGLQHWFMLGLAADGDRESRFLRDRTILDPILSWPFYRAISLRARHHYYLLTKALDIDLIYLEKGISFRKFVKVLRVMFETYDMHGGRQRAEEHQFTGLRGIRVIVAELDIHRSPNLGRKNYPEPEYDEISRARILHVFRDRGMDEALEEVPTDFEGAPVFSGW